MNDKDVLGLLLSCMGAAVGRTDRDSGPMEIYIYMQRTNTIKEIKGVRHRVSETKLQ